MEISANLLLMGIIAIVSFMAWNKPGLQEKLLMDPYRVQQHKEYTRFVTSGFVHGDMLHLFFNLFTMYFFGNVVEMRFISIMDYNVLLGQGLFVAFFLLGVIISDLPTYAKYKNAPMYRSLGASGGVAALVFASILYAPLRDICLYGILCLPGFILGTLYLIYSYYSDKQGKGRINHSAHLYGALFGIAFILFLEPTVALQFVQQISNWKGLF
ncbi:rhomboid family intramembrane serine protease [Algivirga pacifica]|uniref:Rhomboid family intramembrane serine protease n=1 Tax=Algivirga pacifica TaxID=1162670 RepID=A0ABP9D610_9BACT